MKYAIIVLLVILLMESPLPGQTTYKNPILTGMNPDPSICRVGDDFYLVTSTFEYFPGLPIYHSKDLVNWKLIGYALSRANNNPLMGCNASTGGQYAPTLRCHNGTYYIIGTNYGGKGSHGIFCVTADNPAGPWSDPVWIDKWYVDPSLEFINDTMYYLSPDNAGSFLLGIMDPETWQFTSPLRKIASGLGGTSPEGPHFYKRNNYYYVMSAEGGTGFEHREVIQRSKSAWGPYEPCPSNPLLSNMNDPENPFQAIGHADMIQLQDGSWWAVCLGIRPQDGRYHHLGRETFLVPITWSKDGWPVAGSSGGVKEEYPLPNLPQHPWKKDPVRDDFDGNTLKLPWNFIRNPHAEDWSLSDKPGHLALKGSPISFTEKDSPAFICRRQTAFDIAASTKVSFTPTSENEEAGLVIRADDKNHYDLLVTQLNGKRVVMFRKYLKGKIADTNYKEIPEGDIILHISATASEYRFWEQEEGSPAQLLGTAPTQDVSTESVGGFTGVFIGLYASGNGKPNVLPAYFDWFDFEEGPSLPYKWSQGDKTLQIGRSQQPIKQSKTTIK